ncbi:Starch-binding associating with outer membrane [Pedobacter steynii]|uniref:Starch-binding associating with outer membrane n=1 Tax=Pedobacter steynii TaxID=430522 RepID=A0A1G9Y5M7_9SPHI|nr:RagB/SusD family nutrient uptake outer membrane protein [Pedobacter steynii]NQX39617.1 RagB/SusD family nutrient uptake outer membrane protein [Pedobacter steynii]SDN04389.1 Starch-binding associating with outer membrane [Pedobacter steynii]
MKRYITAAALMVFTLGSCTKLDVDVESQLTNGNFPVTPDAFVAATGTVYQKFNASFGVDIWRMYELTSEEAIITARNGGYYDQGRYQTLHKHNWLPDHPIIQGAWQWGYAGISDCNRVLNLLEKSADSPTKTQFLNEIRTMRALYYFYVMDMFGNAPITSFGTAESPKQSTRAEVFAYIEKELLAVSEGLSSPPTVTSEFYGRPTKWMAYALLQKLYINAEHYIGKPMYTESIVYADKIITGSSMALVSDYNTLFSPTNGANSETIFAAIYDANYSAGNAITRFTLHSALRAKYNLPFSPSNAQCTLKEFYDTFNLPGDIRNATWLAGKQFLADGTTKILNGSAQLDFTPEIVLTNTETMDVGPEVNGISRGVRSIKFYPDPNTNSGTRFQNNDMPIFRLADVYLLKAEALLRTGGSMAEVVGLVNKVRVRAKAGEITTITLDGILEERGRELAWEGWRRNDLIRFGKYQGKWGFKAGNEGASRDIFPIPATELVLNKNLKQNTGY